MFKCEKSAKMISCLSNLCQKKTEFLEKYVAPLLLLSLRILVGMVFLKSGLAKISNFESTVFLFEYEYAVPLLSPTVAAYLATFFELACSVFLMAGLATRLAALPLIGMTLVIQFTVIENVMHFYWLAVLVTILTFGAGCISLDGLVKRFCKGCSGK
jgi:putative oxidoreductase